MSITGSWPLDTEVSVALKADKAFLESSVTVACRPSERKGYGDYKTVKKEIERKVTEEVESLYAKVLEMFPVKIVPYNYPLKTAAIDPVEKVIYINRGFFRDKSTFYQLAVIMRHELLHFLLDHHIRMIAELEDRIPESHLSLSQSIHSLYNTLQDFEISEHYTDDDKEVVRKT